MVMNGENIYIAIGNVGSDLIENSAPDASVKRKVFDVRKLAIRIGAAAACLCFMLCGVFVLYKLGYLTASCGSSPGILVDGVYYYHEEHKGICSYTGKSGSTLLISDLFRDDSSFYANTTGVYYTYGRRLCVRYHENGKTETLYKAGDEWTHIRVTGLTEENATLRLYNKNDRVTTALLIDAANGVVTDTVIALSPYADYTEVTEYRAGDRIITCTYKTNRDSTSTVISENGIPMFDESVSASVGNAIGSAVYAGENLIITCYHTDNNGVLQYYTLICADGSNREIHDIKDLMGGTSRYLFYLENYNETDRTYRLSAYDLQTGGRTVLIDDYAQYEIVTDGNLLFTCAPWSHDTACYKLLYDDAGILTGAALVSGDISE